MKSTKYWKEKIHNFLLGGSFFFAAIFLWHLLRVFEVIPNWLLPGPRQTFSVFFNLTTNGELFRLIGISLTNILPAFLGAVLVSLVLGVLIGMNDNFSKIFSPFLSAVYLVPSLAWLPLIILFLGFTRKSIWAMIFISSFIRIIYNVIAGARSVNINWLLAARNFELGRVDTVLKIVLPGALPQILSGMRVGFGSAWRSLIGAEMLVVTAGGLGKYMWMSQWAFKFEQVFAGIIAVALIGVLAEHLIFGKLEQKTLLRWGMMR
jgi:ABC-type nitrate/sulfonate/bicarbonate transport system permease component